MLSFCLPAFSKSPVRIYDNRSRAPADTFVVLASLSSSRTPTSDADMTIDPRQRRTHMLGVFADHPRLLIRVSAEIGNQLLDQIFHQVQTLYSKLRRSLYVQSPGACPGTADATCVPLYRSRAPHVDRPSHRTLYEASWLTLRLGRGSAPDSCPQSPAPERL